MKVTPLTGAMKFLNQVDHRPEGQSRQQHQQQEQKERREGDPSFEEELSKEKIDKALAAFEKDAQTKANGLHASAEGQGPGLRVVLKDASGKVIRQLTGDEFLKLREASAGAAIGVRGKILDQKF